MTAELVSIKPPDRGAGGRPPEDDPRRCTAHLSDGSGERCQRWASEGTNTCPSHGGKTGKKAAQVRGQIDLFDLLPIATRRHKEILEKSQDERVLLKAAEMIYDRTGLEAKSGISIDSTVVRETALSQFLQVKEGRPAPEVEDEEDIVEAEIVEDDEEGLTAEDLI